MDSHPSRATVIVVRAAVAAASKDTNVPCCAQGDQEKASIA
jgi:hypothetical protein